MKLGLSLGYQTAVEHPGRPPGPRPGGRAAGLLGGVGGRGVRLGRADDAGLDRRSDQRGSTSAPAIMQIPARTPAMTAMTAATIDTLSGGRFRLGLGVSGPQVSEGWHGVRFDKPLARTREYVEIVRAALARETVAVRRASSTRCRCPTGRARRCKLGFHPPARGHADLPGRGRAEEPGAGRRDRRRLAGGLLLPGARRRAARRDRAPAGPRPARRWTASTWCRRCRSWSATTWPRAPSWCAGTPRSTSAAWAAGRRTSTTSSPPGWATATPPARCRTCTWPSGSATRRPRYRWSSSTATALLGPVDRIADGLQPRTPTAGVTTLSVSLFAADAESAITTLRTVADALDRAGVGE